MDNPPIRLRKRPGGGFAPGRSSLSRMFGTVADPDVLVADITAWAARFGWDGNHLVRELVYRGIVNLIVGGDDGAGALADRSTAGRFLLPRRAIVDRELGRQLWAAGDHVDQDGGAA